MSIHWNLPDGCTPKDIDKAWGTEIHTCDHCNEPNEELQDDLCPKCVKAQKEDE